MHITKHLVNLHARIRSATASCGRSENEVAILAVTKGHGIDAVEAAYNAGLQSAGENYLQEALQKMPLCNPGIEWHFIGRLQSNKSRAIATAFQWVQTVATVNMARHLSDQRPAALGPLNVCVQVCTDGRSAHGGIEPEGAAELCSVIAGLPGLQLRGLMTVPLPAEGLAAQRQPFRLLRELFADLKQSGFDLDTLSMGMTSDLEAAIVEGSTLIRVGTALFGPRPE